MIPSINFEVALSALTDHWSPKVVAQVNDQYVKVAKLLGQFVWHRHDNEDELFQVIRGRLRIQFEDGRETVLSPGELCVIPRGVMHNPVADEECWVLLVEPVTTKHTGDVETPRTRSIAEQLV
ncbi:cupin domain-containing protein [Azospirillum sp. BE72]|uniref:cupin domain-containing protein n=1 Tax=Azospirillum sp. BE72 TaxID=2817776 RepID=UPI002858ED7B|nr:cupin domain-containing protein [Azospirillum sp. BE72]MDR6773270.1 mannose-6-phosphate isomerase-like protein (cupin superfamily) [Azospirillum sp. BE72]